MLNIKDIRNRYYIIIIENKVQLQKACWKVGY